MEFYAPLKIGPNRRKTPEGFLVCYDVPIARTGEMVYGPGEVPQELGLSVDGRIYISRSPKEVFSLTSMASIAGKPIVDEHPPDDVDPDNYSLYMKGVVVNPRQGKGNLRDFLIADLIVFDRTMIDDIEADKREVSCGYDPEYFPVLDTTGTPVPGKGEQKSILYNHLALVDNGRCGPRCSIGDQRTMDSNTEVRPMAVSFKDRLRGLIAGAGVKGEQMTAIDKALDDMEEGPGGHRVEIHNHMPEGGNDNAASPMATGDDEPPWFQQYRQDCDARFSGLHDAVSGILEHLGNGDRRGRDDDPMDPEITGDEDPGEPEGSRGEGGSGGGASEGAVGAGSKEILGELEFEAPPGTGDKAIKARDSFYLGDAFQHAVSQAEILIPGMTLPEYDRKARPNVTFNQIDKLRRTTLDLAYTSRPEYRGLMDSMLAGRPLQLRRMTVRDVRTMFNSLAAVARDHNQRDNTRPGTADFQQTAGGGAPVKGSVRTLSDLNTRNRALFAKRPATIGR